MTTLLGKTTVTVQRFSGAYVDGIWQPGTPATFTTDLSVQPLAGRERQQLPELYRSRQIAKAYGMPSNTQAELPLKTTDTAASSMADRVVYKGRTYEVISVEDWNDHGLADGAATDHVRYLLAEQGEGGNL